MKHSILNVPEMSQELQQTYAATLKMDLYNNFYAFTFFALLLWLGAVALFMVISGDKDVAVRTKILAALVLMVVSAVCAAGPYHFHQHILPHP